MRYLKTNTATIVTVGPFYDKTDGVTIETGLTITNERITFVVDNNDGSAPTLVLDNVTGATSGTSNDLNYITNNDAGLMQLELAAANVNYLGRAMLSVTDAANHCPVFHEFTILPAMVFDSLIAGTDVLQADMTQILGTAVSTPATAGLLDVNAIQLSGDATAANNAESFFDGTGYAGTNNVIPTVTTTTTATNVTTVNGLAANVITAASIAAGAIDNATFAADVGSTAYATNIIALAADKAVQNAALATAANLATVDTVVDAIKVKTDYLPSATAGAAGGVFIAGTNAATVISSSLTTTFNGNLSGSVGSVTGGVGGAVGSVTGAVGSIGAGGITASSIAADAITAAHIANGAIDAATFAAGAITAAALATDAAEEICDAVWAEPVPASYGLGTAGYIVGTQGATGAGLAAIPWNAAWDAEVQSEATDALNAYDPPTNTELEARTLVAANYATATALDAVDNYVDTEMAAVKAVTDKIDTALVLDGAVYQFTANALELAPSGGAAPTAAAVADAVWDELVTGHAGVGSTGAALAAAGGSGDPWSTALPGSYATGTAGNLLGVQVPAIKAKTDTIGALSVTISAPVATDGASITIIRGDDYLLADSRQIAFTGTNWPVITGGAIAFRIGTSSVTEIAGVITGADACYVELTDTQTTALEPGTYGYDLQATLASGSVITLVQGTLAVVRDVR